MARKPKNEKPERIVIIKTAKGHERISERGRWEVVRRVTKYKKSRKTGKRVAAEWKWIPKSLWAAEHGFERKEDGTWKELAPKFQRKRKATRVKVGAADIALRTKSKEYKDGSRSYYWRKPLGIPFDSPLHTEDVILGMARKFALDAISELPPGVTPLKYRVGWIFRLSKKDDADGNPVWKPGELIASTSYIDKGGIQEALNRMGRKLSVVMQQKAGSMGSGRIWIKAIFVQMRAK